MMGPTIPKGAHLAVTLATEVKRLTEFRCWHVYVWLGARQHATAFVVAANGARVCVTYFPSKFAGVLDPHTSLASDARSLGISQAQLLAEVYQLATLAAGEPMGMTA